jgi:ATP-dependent Zn protease
MSNRFIEVAIAWLPIVVIIGIWAYFMRRFRGPTGMTQGQYMHEIVQENRKHNEALLKVIDQMDRRLARLEDQDRNS